MFTVRRRVLRPQRAAATIAPRRQLVVEKRRAQLDRERSRLNRWMSRLRRACHALKKQQRRLVRLEKSSAILISIESLVETPKSSCGRCLNQPAHGQILIVSPSFL
jgi:hypothetical protein